MIKEVTIYMDTLHTASHAVIRCIREDAAEMMEYGETLPASGACRKARRMYQIAAEIEAQLRGLDFLHQKALDEDLLMG